MTDDDIIRELKERQVKVLCQQTATPEVQRYTLIGLKKVIAQIAEFFSTTESEAFDFILAATSSDPIRLHDKKHHRIYTDIWTDELD